MVSATLFQSLFSYKAWANEELFATLGLLSEESHEQDRHAAIRILNHIYVVDCIFAANLQGLPHAYTATNTTETPTLDALLAAVRETDSWYQNYVARSSAAELDERLSFTFTDGAHGNMNRAEMLMHVITHGGYHRGAVGRILAQLSIAPPRDIFTRYLHGAEPERRNAD